MNVSPYSLRSLAFGFKHKTFSDGMALRQQTVWPESVYKTSGYQSYLLQHVTPARSIRDLSPKSFTKEARSRKY